MRLVGPVVDAGEVGTAIARALGELNPGLQIQDRGAYLRIRAPGRCHLTRAAVEALLGRAFVLPGDLERVMPSFAGNLTIGPDTAEWVG